MVLLHTQISFLVHGDKWKKGDTEARQPTWTKTQNTTGQKRRRRPPPTPDSAAQANILFSG